MFVIIINHVEFYPSGWDILTGRGQLWASAAEGFFAISGLLIGIIYRRRLAQGMRAITKKMWQRALFLYIWSVALTMLFSYWAVAAGDTAIKYGLPIVINWWEMFKEALLLQYSFGWADFLPHFAVFMFIGPLVYYLISKRLWWLVVLGTIIVWSQRGEHFTLAWQLIFFWSMIIGYYWYDLKNWLSTLKSDTIRRAKIGIFWTAAITFIFSYASIFLLYDGLRSHYDQLPGWLADLSDAWYRLTESWWPFFQKWTLEPGRIIIFTIWFSAAYLVVEKYAAPIQKYTFGLIEYLGKRSLIVYIVHAFVIFALHLLTKGTQNIAYNFLLTTAAIIAVFAITWLVEKTQIHLKRRLSEPSAP